MFNRLLAVCFVLMMVGALGCDTDRGTPVGPVLEDGVTVLPSGAYISEIPAQGLVREGYVGDTVKAWIIDDPRGPQAAPYKVIMVLDYPCGAVGPLPEGHGRDCTDDPNGTPSDEPPANPARWFGDPTSDD